ncbi:MAG: flagellar motor protein MotB [Luminiphilus sp.]|nr:flagellar motor protein MotB [Luminiphilus sp.]
MAEEDNIAEQEAPDGEALPEEQAAAEAEAAPPPEPELPPGPPPEPPEELPPVECPKCPGGGAPAWMATFADMATLLMAFFVLLLSFAQMNVPKFKEVSGSMNDSMGVQRVVPVVEPPTSDNIVADQFSQAKVEPTALSTINEQTTDEEQPPDPELKVTTKPSSTPPSDDLQKVRSALKAEIASGKVEVSEADGKISVAMTADQRQGETQGKEGIEQGRRLDEDTVAIYAKVAAAQTQVVSEVQVLQSPSNQDQRYDSGEGAEAAEREQAAQSEYEQIKASLNTEIANGLVNVERIDDEVKISLADQGAFVSGSADLRQSFYSILTSVGDAISGSPGKVTVAGHTDNVPVAFSERFQSNWDLSAARSASVADYLVGQGFIDPASVTVTGFADTVPIASNDTAAGRSQNRRIEITVKGGA